MQPKTHGLTQARLRELLDYEPETGLFTWRVARNSLLIGTVAGHRSVQGYVRIEIDKRKYLAHRLAWLYVRGAWPDKQIDHVNRDKSDNRIANLRDVDCSTNGQNIERPRTGNRSGFLGVRPTKGLRWQAVITPARGRCTHIGVFDTPEQAHAAYVAAKRVMHAGCTI